MQCELIRDLLPLFHDGACSQASRAAVEKHVQECGECKNMLMELDAPLPPVAHPPSSPLSSASSMKAARQKLTRRAALAVLSTLLAATLFIGSGAALYTAFEKIRIIPYSGTPNPLIRSIAQWEEPDGNFSHIEIKLRPKRYSKAECLFRRITTNGKTRDIAILQLRQTWTRQYLDWGAEEPEMVAIGADTELFVSGGGQYHEACYGYEYEPELWNPNWEYPGRVSEIYYLDWPYPSNLQNQSEELIAQYLEQHGTLIWKEGKAEWPILMPGEKNAS